MSTVPMHQALRRVPYLLGGATAHAAPPMPRHAVPALLLPRPRVARVAATGCSTH